MNSYEEITYWTELLEMARKEHDLKMEVFYGELKSQEERTKATIKLDETCDSLRPFFGDVEEDLNKLKIREEK